jgi:hypothetical protein
MSPGAQNIKTGPDALGTVENESGCENMKAGPDALSTVENESGSEKMKTGPDALITAENDSGSAKREKDTRRPRHPQKYVRERKTLKRDRTPSVPR